MGSMAEPFSTLCITTRKFSTAQFILYCRARSARLKLLRTLRSKSFATWSKGCSMKPRGNDEHLVLYQGPDSRSVQRMFAGIAHRYDFLNHLLSGSVDRYWRRIAVRKVRELAGSIGNPVCLDPCSGTGDLALALHRALNTRIIASDFCHA